MNRVLILMLLILGLGCWFLHGLMPDFATATLPQEREYVGESARQHLSLCNQSQLPKVMSDLWVYDGGNWNGTIYYVSFRCETLDDCWQAVRAFRSPEKTEFVERIETRFAVNKHGPSFYFKGYDPPAWDVSEAKDGFSHEHSQGGKYMDFWAIDHARLRVYFHHESGGFPNDSPDLRHLR